MLCTNMYNEIFFFLQEEFVTFGGCTPWRSCWPQSSSVATKPASQCVVLHGESVQCWCSHTNRFTYKLKYSCCPWQPSGKSSRRAQRPWRLSLRSVSLGYEAHCWVKGLPLATSCHLTLDTQIDSRNLSHNCQWSRGIEVILPIAKKSEV